MGLAAKFTLHSPGARSSVEDGCGRTLPSSNKCNLIFSSVFPQGKTRQGETVFQEGRLQIRFGHNTVNGREENL